jgi:geranylgeranyl diphosphate synthase type I
VRDAAAAVPPHDLAGLRAAVEARLAGHLADLEAELAALHPVCVPWLDTLRTTLSAGKRLRAALAYWSWRAHADGPTQATPTAADHERAVRLGVALELFHAAALVHDDVMDASDTRRGHPSAHRALEGEHRAAGWRGDAARFGHSGAILLGDLALVASERELAGATAGLDPDRRAAVRAVFDEMRTEVTAGQYLDVLAEALPWQAAPGAPVADEALARAVVRAKSARYSVEHPLVLGAALAGATPDQRALLREVGLPLGEAFQLRDDLLGVFGDPAATGKPAGDDLREGKRTVLVLRGVALADARGAAALRDRLGDPDLDTDGVEELRAVLRESGAAAAVEGLIEDLAGPALARLAAAPLAEPGRGVLLALGRAAVERDA